MLAPTLLTTRAPAPALRAWVTHYAFVRDLPGAHEGQPIRTAPSPGAVLSINFGRPNAMIDGPTVPAVALLGMQTAARQWRSWSDTWFVMAHLTPLGVARLFPRLGAATVDRLVEVGALLGDAATHALRDDASATDDPRAIAEALDRWLLARAAQTPTTPELALLARALPALVEGVEATAQALGVSRRQLQRWMRAHFGLAPRAFADIARLAASVTAAQTQRGDPRAGYADQAHQIRAWRRRLGVTPGRHAPSQLARTFAGAPVFYL